MEFIDTHAHIYLPEFLSDLPEVLKKAQDASVKRIIMPAIDSSTHAAMMETESSYANCYSMMGLHPCSVKSDYEKELEIVEEHLKKRTFVAIGEIGLDFYWDKTFTEQQYDAFHRQIELAIEHKLPIVIHSRNSTNECIEVVSQHFDAKGVFHCFSGNEEQARKIIDVNFMLGIGGVATFKNGGLDRVVSAVGLSHVVLETDSPYLAPMPYRGKRNEPSYIQFVAEKLSALLNISLENVASITTQNAEKLFNLKRSGD